MLNILLILLDLNFKTIPQIKNIEKYGMAWGRWNGALGEVAKNNYKVSSNEKTIIYGKIL